MARFYILIAVFSFFSASQIRAEAIYSQPLTGSELPVGNLLVWITATENDVQNFIVEKSADGIKFEDLGTVKASGFSKVDRSYRFMDIGAASPKTFYRLREVATDGTASFSVVSAVEKKLQNNLNIVSMSRTEVAKEFRVTFDCTLEASLNWSVVDMRNKMIDSGEFATLNGLNDLKIDFQTIPAGAYKVKLSLDGEDEQIVIRRVEDAILSKPNVASAKKETTGTGRN